MKDTLRNTLSQYANDISPSLFERLAAVCETDESETPQAIKTVTAYAFNTDSPSKGMCRCVFRLLFNFDTSDLTALTFVRVLSTGKNKTNPDALIQMINSQDMALNINAVGTLKSTEVLRHYLNEKRLLKLLWTTDTAFLKDTIAMLDRIKAAKPDLNFVPKKPKSIMQIHEVCVRTLPKLRHDNFDLEQRPDILQLDNKEFGDGLTIRVPKSHYDMIDLGEALRFCIGNGSYSEQVRNKQCSIIAVFDNNKPLYGVQFTRYRILQAHGFSNDPHFSPSKTVLKQLQELLTEAPKLPSDFLPITDSGWIHGYRYNDNDLYLLLNDWVYVYFDVPHDVYEELLTSERKGQYVNSQIKPVYACEKVGHIDHIAIEKAG